MILLDSSCWLECLTGGPLSGRFEPYLKDLPGILTPTIVFYEVYKKARQNFNEDRALFAVAKIQNTNVVQLTEKIALTAADLSIEHSLPMADAIIYATAVEYGCELVTTDAHFEGLSGVVYIKKL